MSSSPYGRNPDRGAVERCALSSNRSETLAPHRIVDQTDDDLLAKFERDRNRDLRIAVREISRAVERIDDPAVFSSRAGDFRFFLRQDRMLGKLALQYFDDALLSRAIDGGDQIDRTFVIDQPGLVPVCANDLPRSAGSLPSRVQEVCVVVSHRSISSQSQCGYVS